MSRDQQIMLGVTLLLRYFRLHREPKRKKTKYWVSKVMEKRNKVGKVNTTSKYLGCLPYPNTRNATFPSREVLSLLPYVPRTIGSPSIDCRTTISERL